MVFALFAMLLLILLLVLVPMLGRQLVRLYQLAPEMLDWLQGTALPPCDAVWLPGGYPVRRSVGKLQGCP